MAKRIIIIEDEALIAAEIESTLQILGYVVVAHEMNGDKALDTLANTPADLILLDINIKGTLSGIDLAKVIRQKYRTPFVFLTSFSDNATLNEVKETLPYGYIVKPFNEHDLRSAIELALYKFETELHSSTFSKAHIENTYNITLTNREFEILSGFREGKTYKEVGNQLYISINTVKSYQKRIFKLLGVASKVELIRKLEGFDGEY